MGAGLVKFTSVGTGLKPGDLLTSNSPSKTPVSIFFILDIKEKVMGRPCQIT
jgi:hypothetical protein